MMEKDEGLKGLKASDILDLLDKTFKTDWENPPSLKDLKQDMLNARPSRDAHVSDIEKWLDILHVEGEAKPKHRDNHSSVQPKLVKKNNEWRYPSLSEPFLSTPDIYNVKPYTFEDKEAARQNALVLNYQFNNKINKVQLVDEGVRVFTDEGTVFFRVGWETIEDEVTTEYPIYELYPVESKDEAKTLAAYASKFQQGIEIPEEWEEAVNASQINGAPYVPVQTGVEMVKETKVIENRPTVEVVDYANLIIDPSCNGDLSKAKFAIYSFETSKSELTALGIYKNIEKIDIDSESVVAVSSSDFETNEETAYNFSDEPRKKFIAHEYWGYWDVNNDGMLKPIVATWVGDTLIRLEENPFPFKSIPFASAQYTPMKKSLYGQPDAEILEDNQKIVGAATRGIIDQMARVSNGQRGVAKDLLDPVNKRRFMNGKDYEFNPTNNPANAIYTHKYSEIPQSAFNMLNMQQAEAEAMTGSRAFGATATQALTASATQSRGALDAASKREVAILRRLAEAFKQIGQMIISMNQEWLEDEEIFRITNDRFIAIKREDLAGRFDLALDISTAEEDNARAQELAFMLQTLGNSVDPMVTYGIMADIADLRKMPKTAEELRNFKPQPNPVEEAKAQIELQKLQLELQTIQLENNKIQLEMQKLASESNLNANKAEVEAAKVDNINADTDNKNLQYIEEEMGVKHERDMEKMSSQARANLERDIINQAIKERVNEKSAIQDILLNQVSNEMANNLGSGNDIQNPVQQPEQLPVDNTGLGFDDTFNEGAVIDPNSQNTGLNQ